MAEGYRGSSRSRSRSLALDVRPSLNPRNLHRRCRMSRHSAVSRPRVSANSIPAHRKRRSRLALHKRRWRSSLARDAHGLRDFDIIQIKSHGVGNDGVGCGECRGVESDAAGCRMEISERSGERFTTWGDRSLREAWPAVQWTLAGVSDATKLSKVVSVCCAPISGIGPQVEVEHPGIPGGRPRASEKGGQDTVATQRHQRAGQIFEVVDKPGKEVFRPVVLYP